MAIFREMIFKNALLVIRLILSLTYELHLPLYNKIKMRMQSVLAINDEGKVDNLINMYFQNIVRVGSEYLNLNNQSLESANSSLLLNNLSELENLAVSNGMVICMGGHFLNHEMLTTIPLYSDKLEYCCIYKSSNNRHIKRLRERYGVTCIPSDTFGLLRQLRMLRDKAIQRHKGLVVGVLNDISPKTKSRVKTLEYNNATINILTGFEHIGTQLGAGFTYIKMDPIKKGMYSVNFICLDNSSNTDQSVTGQYFKLLLHDIASKPQNWLLWGTYSVFFPD